MGTTEKLRTLLDGRYPETRDRVRWWLSQPGNEPADDLPLEEHRERVLAWARELSAEGDTAIGYPVEYGGQGSPARSVTAFETLALGDLSLLVKCGVQFGLFGGAILHLGTERHHERYLRDVASLELPGCFAMTETGHGSNVQALETTATYDSASEELVIHTPHEDARKDYIGNAARDGRMAVVFAQLIAGAQLDPDGTYFSPIENPTKRFFTMLGTLIQGRISVSGASISASKVALTIAVRRALERRQFGPPGGSEALLMDYRTHQRRLLPALAKTYALSFAQQRLVDELDAAFAGHDERERRKLETLAAGVKAVATWHASDTIQSCREACGGAGYLRTSRFAALKADTDVFTTFEGDNTILLQFAAKNLLTDYRDAFGELDPLGLAQFVAGQALGVLTERTPLGKLTDTGDLLARDTQLDLFRWRHEHLLESAAKRLKRGIDSGGDPFSVLIDCQDHVLEAARSWVDLVILESFPEDEALDQVRSLYALHTIEAERGYYQEHGRLSGSRSKAVIKAVNTLCGELRPRARELVDAFGVPENVLGDARAVAEAVA